MAFGNVNYVLCRFSTDRTVAEDFFVFAEPFATDFSTDVFLNSFRHVKVFESKLNTFTVMKGRRKMYYSCLV